MNDFWTAFTMTVVAGLATGLGGIVALFAKEDNKAFLPLSLGFSAGVMIYVSLIELFQEAKAILIKTHPNGAFITVISFFLGMLVISIIDKLLPEERNPHEIPNKKKLSTASTSRSKLKKVGLMTCVGIVIHNFPEGIATFTSGMQDVRLGWVICTAIAIHNIPEGIAVAVPIYYATHSRSKALKYAFLSGLAEPCGALFGMLILNSFMTDTVFGILLAAVAGIMVFISLDELLPTAHEYGEHHLCIYGVVGGMAVMAVTLLLLG